MPFTLTYAAAQYDARVNALILGRPPAPSYGTANDVVGPAPSLPAVVTLTTVNVAYRAVAAVTDVDAQYAVVPGFRDVTRPGGASANPF